MEDEETITDLSRTSEDWEGIVAKLEADRAALVARDAALLTASRPLALDAALGKPDAATQLGAANAERVQLACSIDNVTAALEDARGRLEAARDAEAGASRAERERQAREIAGQIIDADREIDAAFGRLRMAFDERDALVASLRPVGALSTTLFKRLKSPTMTLGAMQAAGLGAHLPLTRTPPQHWQALAVWDSRLLAGLLPPAPVEPVRQLEGAAA